MRARGYCPACGAVIDARDQREVWAEHEYRLTRGRAADDVADSVWNVVRDLQALLTRLNDVDRDKPFGRDDLETLRESLGTLREAQERFRSAPSP
jgi:hypothetical protein